MVHLVDFSNIGLLYWGFIVLSVLSSVHCLYNMIFATKALFKKSSR